MHLVRGKLKMVIRWRRVDVITVILMLTFSGSWLDGWYYGMPSLIGLFKAKDYFYHDRISSNN